mmetsp:Transcript_3749/g.8100  ORF Transcript_3749/g.8100 Transcript_3749/m.8100 type:complete len:1004 (+) Transcript_3749:497-3508(+)
MGHPNLRVLYKKLSQRSSFRRTYRGITASSRTTAAAAAASSSSFFSSERQQEYVAAALSVAAFATVAAATASSWNDDVDLVEVEDHEVELPIDESTDNNDSRLTPIRRRRIQEQQQQLQQSPSIVLDSLLRPWQPQTTLMEERSFFRFFGSGLIGAVVGGNYGNKEDSSDNENTSDNTSNENSSSSNDNKNLYSDHVHKLLVQEARKDQDVESKYKIYWRKPLGEGAFGTVYLAQRKSSGERVAIKKISQRFTNQTSFSNEMGALLQIRQNGGHPNICGLQENFVVVPKDAASDDEEDGYYYLVLDLISGGEMFDHLCRQGAYSELQAARLIREVASAMTFLHGLGIVHGDLKPENLMLSSNQTAKAVIKLVDFGCARSEAVQQALWQQQQEEQQKKGTHRGSKDSPQQKLDYHPSQQNTANTPAYSSPEVLSQKRSDKDEEKYKPIEPSFDMWAVGVILYIMLTGVHPFDLYGNATDAEIEDAVLSGKKPPLGKSPLTAHLSPDATNLIELLLQWNPKNRLTAAQLLEHPWVRGETARTTVIADSDTRLKAYKAYRTKLEAKAFADMISASATEEDLHYQLAAQQQAAASNWGNFFPFSTQDGRADAKSNPRVDINKKMSLIEIAFSRFDPDNKGFIPAKELRKLVGNNDEAASISNDERLSMSCFSDILAANMKNKYYPKGHLMYKEGEVGNSMFFLNSGSVEVCTKDGYRSIRHAGEFFGEGALLNPSKIRSASIKANTPIHVLEISRDYFEKYIGADSDVALKLREKDKSRKRQRAKTLLQLQQHTKEKIYKKGELLFEKGARTNELFIVSEGTVWLEAAGKEKNQRIIPVELGQFCGEHSAVFGRPRNVNARCESDECKALILNARDFKKMLATTPHFKESIREICLRREFQKSLCVATGKLFPKTDKELREAFDEIASLSGDPEFIELEELRATLLQFDPTYTEQDIFDILETLDLHEMGRVSWSEFRRIFGAESAAEPTKEKSENGNKWKRKKWKR